MTITWENLFVFLMEHIKFGDGKNTPMSKTCDNTLVYSEGFCRKHKLDWSWIKLNLEATGGDCDCKVLLNSVSQLDDESEIGTPNKAALVYHNEIIEKLLLEAEAQNRK